MVIGFLMLIGGAIMFCFRITRIASAFAVLACLAVPLAANAAESATHLLPDMPLHDPFIVAHAPSKTYYLYTSNIPQMTGVSRAGTMAYKSKDLRNWSGPTVVFQVPDGTWADANEAAWAPEVHEYKGRYYLFTTLHNAKKLLSNQVNSGYAEHARGVVAAMSDTPDGPFKLLDPDKPVPPSQFMTLDGTLYVDPTGAPWMVYAHEWVQKGDGTFEAMPLKSDLSAAAGTPSHLFKASDAPWLDTTITPDGERLNYVTDGCELFRTKTGDLLMLWSSYKNGQYVETVARSESGSLLGPWHQQQPLLTNDSGHGMLFRNFAGELMMVVHRPFKSAHGKLYEMSDDGDHLTIVRERTDLDGDTQ